MQVGALCAGYGGLELALNHNPVWVADTKPAAAAVLARHWPEAPNLGDLRDITDPPEVDIVTAGFPCQPVSVAGARNGVNDHRWLVDDVCRIASAAGATWLVLENVPGILTANDGDAMARTCEAMARQGFRRWEWGTVRASDVGACHQRKRWFAVASTGPDPRGSGPQGPQPAGRRHVPTRGPVADANGATLRTQPIRLTRAPGEAIPRPDQHPPTNPDSPGRSRIRCGCVHNREPGDDPHGRLRERFGAYAEAVHHWEHILGRPAPNPATERRLNPVFVEWMMGLPEGWVIDTPNLSRADMLDLLGNGVVPAQAAHAIRLLTCPD